MYQLIGKLRSCIIYSIEYFQKEKCRKTFAPAGKHGVCDYIMDLTERKSAWQFYYDDCLVQKIESCTCIVEIVVILIFFNILMA